MEIKVQDIFESYNGILVEAIRAQADYKATIASGNFDRFIQSAESVVMTEDRFLKLGTPYTSTLDVGRGATSNRSGGLVDALYEWLQYKKYDIEYTDDKQRLGIAIAIARSMSKKGSYKRYNDSARTDIFNTAIEQTKPDLLNMLSKSITFNIEEGVQDEIRRINSIKV